MCVCVRERERDLMTSSVIYDRQDVKHQWNHTDGEKTKIVAAKPVPMPHCPPQI